MNTCVLGVDPGLNGALAFYFLSAPHLVSVYDMPVVGVGPKRAIDAAGLGRRIRQIKPDVAVVELVGAMPKQGVSSTFKFGLSTGVVHGVIGALEIPIHFVTPGTWKRHFKVTSDKETSRARAIQLWPACDGFGRKKDADRAEAALIARWWAETNNLREAA